ncbi:MAG: carbon-nitrogen hydrolase family protein [Pelagibacteraceae bacterium]|jgi:deaminated glutathione amidase|nr:carbon-nitrogen hydrolase family protein [Pelagibacteraceae bacterium]
MFKVSCIQICSTDDVKKNLLVSRKLILKAIKQKSDFIITPETSSIFGLKKKKLLKKTTSMNKDIYLKGLRSIAKKYQKWILTCVIIKEKNKIRNRSVLINPKGLIKTYYDKMHMFDVSLSKKEEYFESKTFTAGKSLKTFNLPWGKLGMSICYDVRFPNMFRKLAQKGSIFITVPSAFTRTTGKKHWHSLLQSRAIENLCYIFAPAQCGTHWNGRQTYGHSLIVSPDGKILKELKKGTGIISANIDPKKSIDLRKKIPSLNKS